MRLPVVELPTTRAILVALNCTDPVYSSTILALPLLRAVAETDVYVRCADCMPVLVAVDVFDDCDYRSLYVSSDRTHSSLYSVSTPRLSINLHSFWEQGFSFTEFWPLASDALVEPESNSITLLMPDPDRSVTQLLVMLRFEKRQLGSVIVAFIVKPRVTAQMVSQHWERLEQDAIWDPFSEPHWDRAIATSCKVSKLLKSTEPAREGLLRHPEDIHSQSIIERAVCHVANFEDSYDWTELTFSDRVVLSDTVGHALSIYRGPHGELTMSIDEPEILAFDGMQSVPLLTNQGSPIRHDRMELTRSLAGQLVAPSSPDILPQRWGEANSRSMLIPVPANSPANRALHVTVHELPVTRMPPARKLIFQSRCNLCKGQLTGAHGKLYALHPGAVLPTRCYKCFEEGFIPGSID